MTAADLIAELSKLPPHTEVACAIDYPDAELVDTEGEPVRVSLLPECECFALTEIHWRGTWVQLVGGGTFFPRTTGTSTAP